MDAAAHPTVETPALNAAARLRALVAQEALVVTSLALFAVAFSLRAVAQVNQDAWLALVSGRDIAAYGIPHQETLTLWARGHAWVDQQWLGQLALYGAARLGGLATLAALHVLLTCGAYVLAVVAARRLGASSRAVLALLPVSLWLFVFGTWQVRTQTFSYLPFVAILWLVVRDARTPDRRVFLALPLLALWANLHGAVVLGAALVVLRGLAGLVERRGIARNAALVVLAPAMLLVSPYGAALPGYYRSTVLNSGFGVLVDEWQPTSLGLATFAFFGLALYAGMRVAARPGVLSRFELAVLLATGIAALKAERNVVWFTLAALVLLPRLGASERRSARPPDLALAALSLALALAALGWLASRPDAAFSTAYPERAATLVAQQRGTIYADVRYADWLLWRRPALAGRIAFDARFELLRPLQLASISDVQEPTDAQPPALLRRYGVLVLDPLVDRFALRTLARDPAARTLYRDPEVVVVVRR